MKEGFSSRGRFTNLKRAELLYGFETTQEPVKQWIKSQGLTSDGHLYKWRRHFGFNKERGSKKNIQLAETLIAKFKMSDAAESTILPEPEQLSIIPAPADPGARKSKYSEELKANALAEYRALLADPNTKRGAESAVRRKYGLGHGVLKYWLDRDTGVAKPSGGTKRQVVEARPIEAPSVDIKGAIMFIKNAIEAMGPKRPIELSSQDLLTVHAYHALTGKGNV